MPESGHSDVNGQRVLLVDLCGTLYDSNTTFDFLRSYLGEDGAWRRFERIAGALPIRALNRVLPGDLRRRRAVAFLEGHDRRRLSAAADDFLDGLSRIDDVRRLVERLQEEHDSTYIVSSSLDFIVECAAHKLGFDGGHGSTLCYEDGICTGRITTDLLGRKDALIRRVFPGATCTLLTDNRSDAGCRQLVSRFIGVAPASDPRALHFWSNRVSEVVAYR